MGTSNDHTETNIKSKSVGWCIRFRWWRPRGTKCWSVRMEYYCKVFDVRWMNFYCRIRPLRSLKKRQNKSFGDPKTVQRVVMAGTQRKPYSGYYTFSIKKKQQETLFSITGVFLKRDQVLWFCCIRGCRACVEKSGCVLGSSILLLDEYCRDESSARERQYQN